MDPMDDGVDELRGDVVHPDDPTADAVTATDTVRVAAAIAAAWNAADVAYVIVNGVDRYPAQIGRDLDVVVTRGEGRRVLEIADAVLRQHGWVPTFPPDTWGLRLVAFKGTSGLEVHTVERLAWGVAVLYEAPRAESRVGPFKVDPHAMFVKRIVLPLLAGRTRKVLAARAAFGGKDELLVHVRRIVADRERDDDVDRIGGLLASGDAGELALARSMLARMVLRNAIRSHLVRIPAILLGLVRTRLKAYFRRSGLTIALVGPDGVGKSSVAKRIQEMPDLVFTGVHLRHWRPGLLPDLGRLMRVRKAHDGGPVAPRQQAGRFYGLRLWYYALDFLIGYHVKDRWLLGRQVLVLYDRAFLDMRVDPLRYGLASTDGMMTLWRFLPKPDLIVLLQDDPERTHARKPELSVPEIRRQLDVWHTLIEHGTVHAFIDVDGPPAAVAQRVIRLAVKEFVAQHGR
jgi:thymidylate kinase